MSDAENAKPFEISKKINSGQIIRNSFKKLASKELSDQERALHAKGLWMLKLILSQNYRNFEIYVLLFMLLSHSQSQCWFYLKKSFAFNDKQTRKYRVTKARISDSTTRAKLLSETHRKILPEVHFFSRIEPLQNRKLQHAIMFAVCHYFEPGHSESQRNYCETLAPHNWEA